MSKWQLMTDEYDSMAGSRQNQYETELRELKATTLDEAIFEARELFASLRRYKVPGYDTQYPRNPRLVYNYD